MHRIAKFLTYFLLVVITIFFSIDVQNGASLTGSLGRWILKPFNVAYTVLGNMKHHGVAEGFEMSFRPPRLIPAFDKPTMNNLEEDVYTLHITGDRTPEIWIYNLKNDSLYWKYVMPSGVAENSWDLFSMAIKGDTIFIAPDKTNRIYGISRREKKIVWRMEDLPFLVHHRLAILNNKIYANIRRTAYYPDNFNQINDEGYAIIDPVSSKVEHEFFLLSIIDQINAETPLSELSDNPVGGTDDPFHVNDVNISFFNNEKAGIREGDIFLSARNISSVLHLRSDSLVKIIRGKL